MKTYGLDTNCFIDAVNPSSPSYDALQRILKARESGKAELKVSQHTLHELSPRNDKARQLAEILEVLPHWPIGSWDEQVGPWKQQEGTWDDGKHDDQIQIELKKLAKAGTDIRDRGAYIDALRSAADGFVTSDGELSSPGPSRRINERFSTRVLTPKQLAQELHV